MADPATTHKARAWCFTINNPTPSDNPCHLENDNTVVFAVWSKETGENGTPHWQGFVRYKSARSLSSMKTKFPRAHLTAANGSDEENLRYCTKAPIEGPFQIGEPVAKQGKRNDWVAIKDMCKRKASDMEIADEFPGHYARNYGGIQRLKTIYRPPRTEKPDVTVIYGPPGTGKTYYAINELFEGKCFQKESNTKWWDLYDGEENVLLDEFKGQFTYTDIKRFLDAYDFKGECKGGYMRIPASRIALTTNYMPDTWYDFVKHPFAALERRVTRWIYFYDYKKFRVFSSYQEFKEAATAMVTTDNSVSAQGFSWKPEIVDLTL